MSSIELTPATTSPVLAEPLEIAAKARVEPGYQLALDSSTLELSDFALLEARRLRAREEDGRREEDWSLLVLPLALGEQTFPAMDWSLSGRGERVLRSPPVRLEVHPPDSAVQNPEILGLRGPAPPPPFPWWVLALAAALAAAAAWAWRRRKGAPAASAEPELPPEEEALKGLEELAASDLWARGLHRRYYDRLSELLRRYVERRHGIPTATLTTSDLLRRLRQAGLEAGGAAAAREALEACDLVKFARATPSPEDRDAAVARARRVFTPPAPKPTRAELLEAAPGKRTEP